MENLGNSERPVHPVQTWTVVTPNMSRCTVSRASDEQIKEEDKESVDQYVSKTTDCEDQVRTSSVTGIKTFVASAMKEEFVGDFPYVDEKPSVYINIKKENLTQVTGVIDNDPSIVEGRPSVDYIKEENLTGVIDNDPSNSMVEGKPSADYIKEENVTGVIGNDPSMVEAKPSADYIKEENLPEVIDDVPSMLEANPSIGYKKEMDIPIEKDMKPSLDYAMNWLEEHEETKLSTYTPLHHIKEETKDSFKDSLVAHVSASIKKEVKPFDQNLPGVNENAECTCSTSSSMIEIKPVKVQMKEDPRDTEDQGTVQMKDEQPRIQPYTGEKPYNCDICSAAFADISTLKQHKMIHTGAKAYRCDVCGVELGCTNQVKSHMSTHTGEHFYSCDVCGAEFQATRGLKGHKRTHIGEKPYSCDICSATFAQAGSDTNLNGGLWFCGWPAEFTFPRQSSGGFQIPLYYQQSSYFWFTDHHSTSYLPSM